MDGFLKGIITFCGTGISAFLGAYGIAVLILVVSIIFDVISGYAASKITGKKSKEKFLIGILKKLLIFMLVAFAGLLDILLMTYAGLTIPFVFLLTTFFQISVEGLSFLKNLDRCGIQLPNFLIKLVNTIKDTSDKGEKVDINKDAA